MPSSAREHVCGETVKRFVLVAVLALAVTEPVHAQVGVNIGIRLPGRPTLTVIPGAPVYYAPRDSENIFFYAHQYWLFAGGGWYVGHSWNGPWAGVAPARVPAPLLGVPSATTARLLHSGRGSVVTRRRSGRVITGVSGKRRPTSGLGGSVRRPGTGAETKAEGRGIDS